MPVATIGQRKTSVEVLLVEDRPEDALLLRKQLQKEAADYLSLELTHVDTLSEALQKAAAHSYDVVLLDLGLPDGRGLGNLRRVHQVSPTVPVVIISGVEDEQTAAAAVRAGAFAYVVKRPLEQAEQLLPILADAANSQVKDSGESIQAVRNEGLLRLNAELNILSWDSTCSTLLRWEPSQIEGRTLPELAQPHRREEFRAALSRGANLKDAIRLRLVMPDERTRIIELRCVGADQESTTWAMSGAADTLRAQQALQVVDALLDATRDMVLSQDLEGVIHTCSRSVGPLLGRGDDEIVGRNIGELFSQEQRDTVSPILGAVRKGRVIRDLEVVFEHGDGSDLPMRLSLVPLRDELGGLIGACVIGSPREDVAEEGQTQRERLLLEERNTRLQEDNQLLRAELRALRRGL